MKTENIKILLEEYVIGQRIKEVNWSDMIKFHELYIQT